MFDKTWILWLMRLALAASMLSGVGCVSSIHTYRVTAKAPPKKEGVYYALPRTLVSVTTPVVMKQLKAGDFCDLTAVFFPDVEQPEYGKSFKVGDITSATRGEPDAEQVFIIDVKGHLLEDKKLSMSLTPDGVMTKVDVTSTNHTGEFISQAIKSAGTIASKMAVASLSVEPAPIATPQQLADAQQQCPNLLSSEVQVYLGLAPSDRKFYCDSLSHRERLVYGNMNPYLRESFREYVAKGGGTCVEVKPDDRKAHFLQAFALYQEIVELRQKQNSIAGTSALGSNITPDYLKLVASRVEDPLQDDLNQFFGQEIQKTWNATYEVDAPNTLAAAEQQAALFAWSKDQGICNFKPSGFALVANSVQAAPAEFVPVNCTGPVKFLTAGLAKLRFEGDTGSQASDTITESEADHAGMFYRVPAKALIRVYSGKVEGPKTPGEVPIPKPADADLISMYSTRASVAQIGKVVTLPVSTGGRKTQYTMDLYPDTGALQNFAMTSDAVLDKSMIADVEGATTSLTDAIAARKKAAHTDKELEDLKRQHAILDEQVAIKTAQDQLKPPVTGTTGKDQ